MERNNIKKFNVKQSVFLLLLISVFLILATYAWFTSNTLVKIDSIDVNVAVASGFQISTDAKNWKSVIGPADIIAAGKEYGAQKNHIVNIGDMLDVSTIGEPAVEDDGSGTDVPNGLLRMFKGNIEEDVTLTAAEITEVGMTVDGGGAVTDPGTKEFIAFDVFFKTSSSIPISLDLDPLSGVIGSANRGLSDTRGLENATRIAFVEEGYLTTAQYESTAGNGGIRDIQDKKDASFVSIWEPNANEHTSASVAHAFSTYSQVIGLNTRFIHSGVADVISFADRVALAQTWNSAHSPLFELVTPAIRTDKPLDDPLYNATTRNWRDGTGTITSATVSGTTVDLAGGETIATGIVLKEGVTKVRVYMWVEGQDFDCHDGASGGTLKFNLNFTRSESTTP